MLSPRVAMVGLLLIILALSAVRLPPVWFRMGGQDEQWYSVPGWTVANEGIPRIPYVPTDSEESVFQGADKVLYALPPLYFYWQAPFFWILPAGYGAARVASLFAGAILLAGLYYLMRRCGVQRHVALACLPIAALGRAFYFPWQDTRPDMLCAMLGIVAICVTVELLNRDSAWLAALAGILIGLGALTHPYAILFAMQFALLMLFGSRHPITKRVSLCAIAGGTTLLTLTGWLPLIALDSDLFWRQFSINVLDRSGPGLVSRIAWPIPYLQEQSRLIVERLGIYQVMLLIGTLAVGLLVLLRRTLIRPTLASPESTVSQPDWLPWFLAYSTLHLHIALLAYHPAQGYLCYPWALLVLLFGSLVGQSTSKVASLRPAVLGLAACLLALLLLIPGSGLRATWNYASRNHLPEYNRRLFCEQLNERFPADARLLVSPEYVFEFELLGRKPVNASRLPLYHDVAGLPFDYLIASTQAFDEGIPDYLHCSEVWTLGNEEDPMACFVRVYEPTDETPRDLAWPR